PQPRREPTRVDDVLQVVVDEAPAVVLLVAEVAKVLLERGQWAREADGDDRQRVDGGRQVHPEHPGPAPGDEASERHEEDKRDMEDRDEVSEPAKEHAPASSMRVMVG